GRSSNRRVLWLSLVSGARLPPALAYGPRPSRGGYGPALVAGAHAAQAHLRHEAGLRKTHAPGILLPIARDRQGQGAAAFSRRTETAGRHDTQRTCPRRTSRPEERRGTAPLSPLARRGGVPPVQPGQREQSLSQAHAPGTRPRRAGCRPYQPFPRIPPSPPAAPPA